MIDKIYVLLAAAFIAAGTEPVSAEDGARLDPGFLRKHIQVIESPVRFNAPCDMLPTGGDIARAALATLERNRAQFKITQKIDIASGRVPLDPDALKVTLNVQVDVAPATPAGIHLAQSVETQIAFWWSPQPVQPLMGTIRTASGQRICDAALAQSIVADAVGMIQAFADEVGAQQRRAMPK